MPKGNVREIVMRLLRKPHTDETAADGMFLAVYALGLYPLRTDTDLKRQVGLWLMARESLLKVDSGETDNANDISSHLFNGA